MNQPMMISWANLSEDGSAGPSPGSSAPREALSASILQRWPRKMKLR